LNKQITKNNTYLDKAINCGEITWARGLLRKGYGLCHGVAGNGYTLLDLYKTTSDPKWLHRSYMVSNSYENFFYVFFQLH
jgi:lantibiotic modifying enzyme